MNRLLVSAAAVAATFLTGGITAPAEADIIRTTAFGSGADTFASNASAQQATNFGTNAEIQVKRDSVNQRLGYLRFDIAGLGDGITSADIVSADLSLTIASGVTTSPNPYTRSYDLWGLVDVSTPTPAGAGAADDRLTGWSELGLNWNNAPARDSGSGNDVAGIRTIDGPRGDTPTGTPTALGVFIGTFTPTVNATDATITFGSNNSNATTSTGFESNLLSFLNADTNGLVSFAFNWTTGAGIAQARFHSKENTVNPLFAPTLAVVIPEPTAAAGFALMGLTLLRRRRARVV